MWNLELYNIVERLLDVLTVVLYGMLVVRAVESRWHWFVRTAFVGLALAALLVLPAHTHAIELTVAAAAFAAGYKLFRRDGSQSKSTAASSLPKDAWPRVSLRDVLLLTIIAAVLLTVCVRAPKRSAYNWLFTPVDGAVIALMGLGCVWLALGRTRLRWRLAAAPLIFAFNFLATRLWLTWFHFGVTSFNYAYATPARHFADTWRRFSLAIWPKYLQEWTTPVLIGTFAFVVWLVLVKRAGWLRAPVANPGVLSTSVGSKVAARNKARWAAGLLTVLIAALPCYVWVRVDIPNPFPPEAFVSDANCQELVRLADQLYKDSGNGNTSLWDPSVSNAQYASLLARDEPLWQQVRNIIHEGCQFRWVSYDDVKNPQMQFLSYLLLIRMTRGDGTANLDPKLTAYLDAIRLSELEQRSCHPSMGIFAIGQSYAEQTLWGLRNQLSLDDCKRCLDVMLPLELQREPWDQADERSRTILWNAGWQERSQRLLRDVTGVTRPEYSFARAVALNSRMLITALAIRDYELEHGRVPTRLAELVPATIPQLPDDPFGSGPLGYMLDGNSYILYSFGLNGTDDGGRYDRPIGPGIGGWVWTGDVTMNEVFPLPRARPTPAIAKPAATATSAPQK